MLHKAIYNAVKSYTLHCSIVHVELVERVFLRLGAAETDEQLEKALNKFLPAVILKLTSQHKSVQDKVSVPCLVTCYTCTLIGVVLNSSFACYSCCGLGCVFHIVRMCCE